MFKHKNKVPGFFSLAKTKKAVPAPNSDQPIKSTSARP